MARNGSGTYSLPLASVVTGTVISSTWANTTLDDIATALTGSLAKDGQTVVTGTIDFNGNKLILDADADTSITADTDDRVDFEVSGADKMRLTATALTLVADFKCGDATTIGDTPTSPFSVADSISNNYVGILQGTANDANAVGLLLDRTRTAVDADALFNIDFRGRDDAGNNQVYASIQVVATDSGNGSEDGTISIVTPVAGTSATRFTVGGGLYSGSVTGGDKGAGSINAGSMYLNGEQFGGAWTTPTYSAGNFTASGSMTWTVDSGDVTTYAYTIIGKTMTVIFSLAGTDVAGVTSSILSIAIPASKVATKRTGSLIQYTNPGGSAFGFATVSASGTVINLFSSAAAANWSVAAGQTDLVGQITFEIN